MEKERDFAKVEVARSNRAGSTKSGSKVQRPKSKVLSRTETLDFGLETLD